MLLSRRLAKRRIAQGVRPTFVAAWGPVLFDAAVICGVLALITPMLMRTITAGQPLSGWTIVVLFGVYFVPVQAVIIWASVWASMSRWRDAEPDERS